MTSPAAPRLAALAAPMRFAAVGVCATAVHFVTGLSIVHAAGWAPWAANIVAFLTALVVSYVGHSVFTFRVAVNRKDAFARFAMLSGAAFVMNQGMVTVMTETFAWSYVVSLLIVTAIVPPVTYLLSRHWALAERA